MIIHDTQLEVWRQVIPNGPDQFMLVDPVRRWVINPGGWLGAPALRDSMQNYVAYYLEVLANPQDFPTTAKGYALRWQRDMSRCRMFSVIKHTIEEFMSHANPNNPVTETIRINSVVTEVTRTVKVTVEKKVRDETTISLTDAQVVLLTMLAGRCIGADDLYEKLSETSAYKEALAVTGHSGNVLANGLLEFCTNAIRPNLKAIAAIFNK